ncbi:MAG: fasciclin domain-containing protein [Chloroflexota bacterium]
MGRSGSTLSLKRDGFREGRVAKGLGRGRGGEARAWLWAGVRRSTAPTKIHRIAPPDDAFEALYVALGPDGSPDLPAALVLDVLLSPVTEDRRAANSVVPPVRDHVITPLLGATFTVDRNATITDVAGQDVNTVAADISASSGIVHLIDVVLLLLPP